MSAAEWGQHADGHGSQYWEARQLRADAAEMLRGVTLACWCALGRPCHADVLLEIANAPAEAS